MSHSLLIAHRRDHVRIVSVSLALAFVFMASLVAARSGQPDDRMLSASGPTVVKPDKVTTFTNRDSTHSVR